MAVLKSIFAFLVLLFFILTTAALSSFAAPASTGTKLPKAKDFVELGGSDEDTAGTKDSKATGKEGESELGKDSTAKAANENEKLLTGTVRVMRKIQYTEVFFKDINDSYIIPSGNNYYGIYKAMTESQKKGTAVSFKANTKSRRILSMEETPEPGSANTSAAGSEAGAGASSGTGSSSKSGSQK